MAEDFSKLAADDNPAKFLDAFRKVMETVVAPAMAAIGEGMRTKGYDYNISRFEGVPEREHEEGRAAFIRLTIYDTPRGAGVGYKYPGLTVSCSQQLGKVDIHSSMTGPKHGGGAGESGSFDLDQVTSELIQRQALKMMAEISPWG